MRTVVVPAAGGPGDRPVFETALRVGDLLSAHLVFLHVRTDVVQVVAAMLAGQADGPIGLDDMQGDLERDSAERERQARHAVEAFCAQRQLPLPGEAASGVSAEWVSAMGVVADVLVAHARAADLIVMGRDEVGNVLSEVLMDGGRPVLLAPPSLDGGAARPDLLDLVVVAWNDTAEAARAVTAAMPLLAQARSVAILTVAPGDDDAMPASAERLAANLRRVVSSVAVSVLRAERQGAGEALLQAAQAAGAGLLVMGGFSHSRLRELVFGGFTSDLLATATLPVLIAH